MHDITISTAKDLLGDVAYRAICSCSKTIDHWWHADQFDGGQPEAQAHAAAKRSGAAHVAAEAKKASRVVAA